MRRWTPFVALVLCASAPAAADATVFHAVNERGIAQLTFYRVNGNGPFLGDADGSTDVAVAAGDTVRFSRAAGSGGCTEPEGAGIDYVVPSTPPAEDTITFPVTTGPSYQPENSDAERWIIGQLNRRRAERGLSPLTVSATLSRAADAVARDSGLIWASSGTFPFPPPFCDVIQIDWGFPALSFSIVDQKGTDPRSAFEHWSDGSPRETMGTLGDWDSVGVGDGNGAFIAYFARCPASASARCELTGDRGDPDIVLPAPPPGGSGPAGGGGASGGGSGSGGSGSGGSGDQGGGGAATPKPPAGEAKATGRAKARANKRMRFAARILASCTAPPGCYVAATAVAAPRRRPRAAALPVLARGGFQLAGGKSKKVRLTVSDAGRSKLERSKRVRLLVTVTVKAAGFTAAEAQRTVVLSRPRR